MCSVVQNLFTRVIRRKKFYTIFAFIIYLLELEGTSCMGKSYGRSVTSIDDIPVG